MKMSKVLRYLSQVVFWCMMVLFLDCLFSANSSEGFLVLMTLLTVVGCHFARVVKNRLLTFVCHMLVGVIPGFFVVMNKLPIVTLFFGIGIIVLSLIASWADAEYMDKPHRFGQFLLLISYILAIILDYDKLWWHFALFVIYTFIIFIEKNVRENEEYIHGVSYTSVMDIKKMHNVANMVTLIISLGMLLISVMFAFVGKIGPIDQFGKFIFSKLRKWLSFLKNINANFGDSSMSEDGTENLPDDDSVILPGQSSGENISTLSDTMFDKVVMIALIALTIGCLLLSIFLIMRKLYKKYLLSQKDGVEEQQISIAKTKKKKQEDPKKSDVSYNNRKAVRKIYKKRVKGKSRRREDFYNYTPTEQLNKSLAEGNDVSEEMVEIYEKARYSNEIITKDDVRVMKEI